MSDSKNRQDQAVVKVVIVEDNSTYRHALETGLNSSENVSCLLAVSSAEAALKGIEDGLTPDIILLDLELPGMGGLPAIRKFKEALAAVDVLILTQFDDRPNVVEAISQGASGYLLKTASLSDITAGILEIRAGGAPLNPRIAKMVLAAFSRNVSRKGSDDLTPREREILELLSRGFIKKQVAENLGLSYYTVDSHVRHIYEKLQVHNLAGAISKAARRRLF